MVHTFLKNEDSYESWDYYVVQGDREITLLSRNFKQVIRIT